MSEIKGSIAIDTGVLVEYIEDSALGKKFKEKILENDTFEEFHISPLVYTEILYIYCRSIGFDQAKLTVQSFLKDFIIADELQLRNEAAKLKCEYAISIADCYSIALAISKNLSLYMKKEAELEKALIKAKFPIEIIFIDNL
ncbi:MAG TPA: PIN domain-containing protein [Candidatus Deferrimicrobium sp.]|nr:PIN domain-containing protein [Candidatus Deferrimicrobium sp.]